MGETSLSPAGTRLVEDLARRYPNFAGYASPEVDTLLVKIRAEPDAAKRLEMERALHRRLYEDQPYLFMTARQTLDAAKTRVHGIIPSLLWYDLRRVWVDP